MITRTRHFPIGAGLAVLGLGSLALFAPGRLARAEEPARPAGAGYMLTVADGQTRTACKLAINNQQCLVRGPLPPPVAAARVRPGR